MTWPNPSPVVVVENGEAAASAHSRDVVYVHAANGLGGPPVPTVRAARWRRKDASAVVQQCDEWSWITI